MKKTEDRQSMGLREEKKKKTRKAISDLATRLFLERGYHQVTTAEIAELAEVSVPTLFNYFPTKESLVFDEDSEMEADLINTVVNRKKGQGILSALLEAGIQSIDSMKEDDKKSFAKFVSFIESTPELNLYSQQMWMCHERALARAIQKEAKKKLSALEADTIARFVLDSYHRSMRQPQPKAALKQMFKIIETGWAH